jgi:hypothetical protein
MALEQREIVAVPAVHEHMRERANSTRGERMRQS